MANIGVGRAAELSARDVMHAQTSALDPLTTVAQARVYFAASSSRRLAIVAQDGRYVGALTPSDLEAAGDPARPALEGVPPRPTIGPDDSAALARDLAAASETRRVPVVDVDGRYLGIVSLNRGLEWFCGTG